MKIFYSPTFKKRYKKLPEEIKLQAEKKEVLFRKNLFYSSLGTHKLHGRMQSLYAFWINKEYRIIFEFIDENVVRFHVVGKYDIYK